MSSNRQEAVNSESTVLKPLLTDKIKLVTTEFTRNKNYETEQIQVPHSKTTNRIHSTTANKHIHAKLIRLCNNSLTVYILM